MGRGLATQRGVVTRRGCCYELHALRGLSGRASQAHGLELLSPGIELLGN
jgi:hypothetical protein